MPQPFFTSDHDSYRDSVREFLKREVVPHHDDWEEQRLVDRSAWRAAGANGVVGLAVPEAYGGAGESDAPPVTRTTLFSNRMMTLLCW